ncbi:GNAT family N-acetyltransferase [Salinicoccus sp. CNSTN-B1]
MDLRTIHLGELPALLELQKEVYRGLENKEVLQTLTRAEFKAIIQQGFIIGAYDEGELAGTRSMYIPSPDEEEHLAENAGIDDRDSVIYSEISFIKPAVRGQGLQTRMGERLLEKVRSDGRFEYVLTTVMPNNIPSLKDKFKLGFRIVDTAYKYNGKKRHVMQLDLSEGYEPSGNHASSIMRTQNGCF